MFTSYFLSNPSLLFVLFVMWLTGEPNADKSATGKDFPVKDKETKF